MSNLKHILGLFDDPVRIYYFDENREIEKEEMVYCQMLHEIVFGEKGLAQTLGPTWEMIHDSRFSKIEAMTIINRQAIFGGDARLGVQYITENGPLSSSIGDLEKYSEILGEGRNFHNVLVHPDTDCPMRQWLERIYTGYTLVRPHLSFRCRCTGKAIEPSDFWNAPAEDVWNLIRQECPNRAFTQKGTPTPYGEMVFKLIRADLIGLIHDYAETPLIDSYIYLRDNGVVVSAEAVQKLDPHGVDHQRVLQEIDILEQALTHRATLRVTATKVLTSLGFEQFLSEFQTPDKPKVELTDIERDELLRIVYTSKWPDEKTNLVIRLAGFIAAVTKKSLAERQDQQLHKAKARSQDTINKLLDGTLQPINHYTEPVLEIPRDTQENEVMRFAAIMDSLTKNPLKAELFQVYVAAEMDGELGVLDILTPIFDPNYELDEETYFNLLRAVTRRARSLRVMDTEEVIPRGTTDTGSLPMEVQEIEGEFHGRDSLKK
jgi:hypothetical protein